MTVENSTMTCDYASDVLSTAAFIKGATYPCYRDADKKVFVVDSLGFHTEIKSGVTGTDGSSVWACVVVCSGIEGAYHFKRNI